MNSNFENCSVDVICPVYNKAHLIDGFITSFLNKLPKSNFNLILINDGSSDNLEEVISKYAHDNIQLYNKENGGVSSARNMGLTISKAEYVWFCDPDDEIIANGEDIIKLLYKEKADIYVFAYEESKLDSKKIYVKKNKANNKYNFSDYLLQYDYFGSNNGISTLWNKIYQRCILEEHYFDVNLSNAEDRMFNLDILSGNGICYVSDLIIYNHIIYKEGTLSTVKSAKKIEDIKKVNEKNIEILSLYKSNLNLEKKMNILILCKELMLYGQKGITAYYFKEHKKQTIKIFPLVSWMEVLFMMPFNLYIYKTIKIINRLLTRS